MTAVLHQHLQDSRHPYAKLNNSILTDCGVRGFLFLLFEVSGRIIGTKQESRFSPRGFNLSSPFIPPLSSVLVTRSFCSLSSTSNLHYLLRCMLKRVFSPRLEYVLNAKTTSHHSCFFAHQHLI